MFEMFQQHEDLAPPPKAPARRGSSQVRRSRGAPIAMLQRAAPLQAPLPLPLGRGSGRPTSSSGIEENSFKIENGIKTANSASDTPSIAGNQTKKIESSPMEQTNVVFATVPEELNRAIELHDENVALRSTTIKTGLGCWIRIRQKNLLSSPNTSHLNRSDIASEKSRAFDLLDALSRSGSLDIPFSELHVIICATHSFSKNVMDTVIKDNVNPIEKLEMSTLLMASTILGVPARDLIRDGEDRKRLENSFPLLLCNGAEDQETDVVDTDAIDTDVIDS